MALIKFLQPKNKLEEGGRTKAFIQQDDGEPQEICPNCHKEIPISRLWAEQLCCTCGHHFRMTARQRIQVLTDAGSFIEFDEDLTADNPLSFPGYQNKLENVRAISGEKEAVVCGTARIKGQSCCLFVMDSYFMMGSMGSAVGEKITRVFEYAIVQKLPVIGYTVSGGARMQEGLLSLMQMAKTSAVIRRHSDAGLLYIAVLTDPTTGGVIASFAMEADITLAEPGALIGFAGARVIEQTTKKSLPKGFQTAEFVMEHGFIDHIVPRFKQAEVLSELIKLHTGGEDSGNEGIQ